MKNILKPFAVSAIPSDQNNFARAVILLTVYYTLGVCVILVVFNLIVYGMFGTSIRSGEDESGAAHVAHEQSEELGESVIEEIESDLARILLIADMLILILTVVVAYALSRRTLTPLEDSYRKQARFVADAAHELRTPLAVMTAGGEVMLSKARSPEEYRAFIETTLGETKRLTTLSNDLLFLARTRNTPATTHTPVAFSELCQKQLAMMGAYADLQGVALVNEIDPDIRVFGIPEDLVRLLVNLIKNAIDYNHQGGSVTVRLTKIQNQARLSITDTGSGIASDALPHIFERFYKADQARSTSGTGLGLAIVKEIIDAHRGSIHIDSTVGVGTVCTVTLPLA